MALGHLIAVGSSYRYVNGKCSEELHSAVPPERTFLVRTRFAMSSKSHPHFLTVPRTRCNFHADSFIPRASKLWNELPRESFPDEYDLKTFKSRVNKHLSQLKRWLLALINYTSVTPCLEWSSGLTWGESQYKKKENRIKFWFKNTFWFFEFTIIWYLVFKHKLKGG